MAATNYNNDKTVSYSGDVNTAPDKFTLLTGVFTSSGRFVTGSGTFFLTEIGGDSGLGNPTLVGGNLDNAWLFNGADECRKITGVVDNTHLVLEAAFTVDVVATRAVRYVQPSRTMQWSYVVISGTAVIDGVSEAANEASGFGYTASTPNRTTDAVVIDSTAGVVHVSKFTGN